MNFIHPTCWKNLMKRKARDTFQRLKNISSATIIIITIEITKSKTATQMSVLKNNFSFETLLGGYSSKQTHTGSITLKETTLPTTKRFPYHST